MENNKSKGLIVLVIILSILVVGFGGYIFYDKVLKKTNNETQEFQNGNQKNEENNSQDNNSTNYNYTLSKRTTIQEIGKGYFNILIDTQGNAYLSTGGNLDYEKDEILKTNVKNIEKKFKTYSPKDYISYGGDSTEITAYKLNMTNVLTSFYVYVGNGGSSYFVFIKENGKLSYLSYDKLIHNGEIYLQDINNLDNIISVVENYYSMTPYAIDVNGNEISLYDYIK